MLFSDRLEIWNPGSLPPSLTLEKLRVAHGSVPGNPLLAESMYLTRYIERMGTGTGDMIRRCRDAGLPEPEFAVTDGFQTVIPRLQGDETGELPSMKLSQDVTGEKTSGKTSVIILDMIRQQPEITIPEMAEALGRTRRAIEMQLAKLKESRKLQRIGPARGGSWKVLEDNDE